MPFCCGKIDLVKGQVRRQRKGIRDVRACHGFTAVFADSKLVSCTGRAPVPRLAERAGLQRLVAAHVKPGRPGGVDAHLEVPSLVTGMIAGADSIADMALRRHGAMPRLFMRVRVPPRWARSCAPSPSAMSGQLDAVEFRLLVNLTGQTPLLAGIDQRAYVDVDDLSQTYGYAKQGAGRGYTGVKDLNTLFAAVSPPPSRR